MAIKRRPTDEDDEYDDEDDDRPRKKRRPRDEEDEDGEDRPRGRVRSRSRDDDDDEDEDEEEERRPRKRRSRAEEDEDDDEEDERPPRKRRARGDDEEDETADDEEDERKDDDEEDKDKDDEDDEEDPYRQWQKKQYVKRQQFVVTGEAFLTFRKRAQFHITMLATAVIGVPVVGGATFLFGASLGVMILGVIGLIMTALQIAIPTSGIIGANKFKAGIPKLAEQPGLTIDMVGCVMVLVLYLLPVPVYFLLGIADFATLVINLVAGIAYFIAYHVSFALGLFYLRTAALHFKDRLVAGNAQFRAIQILMVAFIGTPLLGIAAFFLHKMGMVGDSVTLGLSIVWLLSYLKGFAQFMEVCTMLNIHVQKKIVRLDKPDW